MTINSEIRRAGPFTGNGVTTRFPFDFKVFRAEDLYVVVAPAEGDGELPLHLGTDYTVELNPDQNANPGGTIVAPSPLPVGFRLTATSSLEYLQPIDLTNQGGFYPRVINDGLDRLTIFVQQLFEGLGRSLKIPLSDGPIRTQLPGKAARANRLLSFNQNGEPTATAFDIDELGHAAVAARIAADEAKQSEIIAVDAAGRAEDAAEYAESASDLVGRQVAAVTPSVERFSGDGETVSFALSVVPGSENNTQVYISGVYQQKDTYEIDGVNLIFSEAPPEGDDNIEVVIAPNVMLERANAQDVVYTGPDGLAYSLQDLADPDRGAALIARGSVSVNTRSELASLPTGTGLTALLISGGSSGLFKFDPSDMSDKVALDPLGGVYVPPVGQDGSSGAWVRSDIIEGVRPEWWGAKGNAVIDDGVLVSGDDDYEAWRACVEFVEAHHGLGRGTFPSCILVGDRGYLIGQTIPCIGNFMLRGAHNPKHITRGPGAFITTYPEVEAIFLLKGFPSAGRPEGAAGTSYGFELDHVAFRGTTVGGVRPRAAVKSTAIGAPARPFNVRSCQARGFDDFILVDVSEMYGDGDTGVYNLNITDSVISGCTNAVHGIGQNCIGGLRFEGNVSEQGGRIRITGTPGGADYGGFGTFTIRDNLLEGQSDTIHIEMGKGVVDIGPNYWEGNSGVDIYVSATNPQTEVFIDRQYVRSVSRKVQVDVGNCTLTTRCNASDDAAGFALLTGANSRGNRRGGGVGGGLHIQDSAIRVRVTLDPVLAASASPAPGAYPSIATTLVEASGRYRIWNQYIGSDMVCAKLPASRDSSLLGSPCSENDVAVLLGWAYNPGASPVNLGITLYDQSFSSIASESGVLTLSPGWNFFMCARRPSANSATGHRWRLNDPSESIYIGDRLAYVAPVNNSGRLPYGWPVAMTPIE